MLTATNYVNIGDDALEDAYFKLSTLTGIEQLEFPPSALIACLLLHADYNGWDFDKAVKVAREFGAAPSFYITNALEDK